MVCSKINEIAPFCFTVPLATSEKGVCSKKKAFASSESKFLPLRVGHNFVRIVSHESVLIYL